METADPYIQMPLYYKAALEGNIQVLAFAGYPMSALLSANTDSKFFINNPDYPDFFEKLHELTLKTEIREKNLKGKYSPGLMQLSGKAISMLPCFIW